MSRSSASKISLLPYLAAFSAFFIMGFVDVVGVSTNYVKKDFALSPGLAGVLPGLVFLWFAVVSIPTGLFMGRVGRKKTALLSLVITAVAMLIPYHFYTFPMVLIAFVMLGIGNTILQVSLNPLVAAMFSKDKTAGILTLGQFIKAISSFLGPILAGVCAGSFGDWKLVFVVFGAASLLSAALLSFSKITNAGVESHPATFGESLALLKDRFILYCFLCIFLIVGFDVGMNVYVPELLEQHAGAATEQAGYGTSIYFAARTLGAFLGSFVLLKTKPSKYLLTSLIVAIIAFPALMFARHLTALQVLVFVLGFACANVFSIIFSFALQRNPERANEISALMIMGIVGGAIIPFVQGLAYDAFDNFEVALSLTLLCLVFVLWLSLNLRRKIQQTTN